MEAVIAEQNEIISQYIKQQETVNAWYVDLQKREEDLKNRIEVFERKQHAVDRWESRLGLQEQSVRAREEKLGHEHQELKKFEHTLHNWSDDLTKREDELMKNDKAFQAREEETTLANIDHEKRVLVQMEELKKLVEHLSEVHEKALCEFEEREKELMTENDRLKRELAQLQESVDIISRLRPRKVKRV